MAGRGRHRGRPADDGWGDWGGYMQAKVQKLNVQDQASVIDSDIFKGVAIFVNGYTNPTSDDLKILVTKNGGVFHHYYSRTKVTHIVATNLPTSKITQLRDQKVVAPEWITDSVQAGKLLPYQKYLLYDTKSGKHCNLLQSLKAVVTSGPSQASGCVSNEGEIEIDSTRNDVDLNDLDLADLSSEFVTGPSNVITCDNNSSKTLGETSSKSVVAESARLPAKAGDANFVSDFYNNSRLHHISMWGSECKAYVGKLQTTGRTSFPGRERLRSICEQRELENLGPVSIGSKKVVMHIDMDCFFVSVGLRNRPELKGKPVAVTHSKGKGPVKNDQSTAIEEAYWKQHFGEMEGEETKTENEPKLKLKLATEAGDVCNSKADIASCSYEARQAGVRNGMFFGQAKRLCPDIIPIPYDFDAYKEVSQQLYDTAASYTLDIEAISCDELYIDCTDLLADTGATPLEFSTLLRQEILDKTRCSSSAGLGGNMLLARMATKAAKPNGQLWVTPDQVSNFMANINVSDLPGVGYALSRKLASLGIKTCADLQSFSLTNLQNHLGQKTGAMLHKYAKGQDDRSFKSTIERKSVSAEINYGIRFTMLDEADDFLGELAAEVHNRLSKLNRKGKTVTLKLKVRQPDAPKTTAKFMGHGICDNVCKSSTLPVSTDSADAIAQECRVMLRQLKVAVEDLRGIGIQMTSLEAPVGILPTTSGCRSILNFTKVVTSSEPSRNTQIATDITQMTANFKQPSQFESISKRSSIQHPSSCISLHKNKEKRIDRIFPPLPTLSDFDNSDVNIPTANNDDNIDFLLPSPSQIDSKVLNELPDNVRLEIEQAMLEQGRKVDPTLHASTSNQPLESLNHDGSFIDDGEKPGCSHWNQNRSRKPDIKPSTSMTLPPLSQLDVSCLEALPEDIRNEIESAYGVQDQVNAGSSVSPGKIVHPLMRPENRNSPQKQKQSPTKKSPVKRNSPNKKSSPSFKVPLGKPVRRKRVLSKRQLQFNSMKQTSASLSSTVSSAEVSRTLKTVALVNHPAVAEEASAGVDLAGCVSLVDVKKLIREWMQTCEEPSGDDTDVFVSYLVRLVQSHDLEQVYLLLKFMNRLSSKAMSWREGTMKIIDQTQTAVKTLYGGPLKLNF